MRYALPASSLLLAACATTDPGDGQVSIVKTDNGRQIFGANCVVMAGGARWDIVTPATLMTGGGSGDLRIVCDKPGYRTSELILPPYGPSGSGVGLGVGGSSDNIGLGPGFSFPVATGGSYYPAQIVVNMNPL